MNRLDDLVKKKPRDASGARSANRFSFQVHWALCKMLELHGGGHEYLLVLDLHEDVVVLNSEHAPTRIDFNQIKTDDGNGWTLAALLKRKAGKIGASLSILGKLYANRVTFEDVPGLLAFVSNAPCNGLVLWKPAKGNHTVIRFDQLKKAAQKKIVNSVRAEHGLAVDPPLDDLRFERTDLSLLDHVNHTRGKLDSFLDDLSPGAGYPTATVYRVLVDRLQRKNNWETVPQTVADLLARKSIGRAEVTRLLAELHPAQDVRQLAQLVRQRLLDDGFSLADVRAISGALRQYSLERLDPRNVGLRELRQRVRAAVDVSAATDMRDLIDGVAAAAGTVPVPYQGTYLAAMILREYFDDEPALPQADPEPPRGPA